MEPPGNSTSDIRGEADLVSLLEIRRSLFDVRNKLAFTAQPNRVPAAMFKFDNTLNRLRSIGTLEAISYLLLLGVAVPLKHIWGHPEAVRAIGMAHGLLWMAYVGLTVLGQIDYKWSAKTTAWLFLASILPFGPFVADSKLLRKVEAEAKRFVSRRAFSQLKIHHSRAHAFQPSAKISAHKLSPALPGYKAKGL